MRTSVAETSLAQLLKSKPEKRVYPTNPIEKSTAGFFAGAPQRKHNADGGKSSRPLYGSGLNKRRNIAWRL